jgi:phosphate transport system protein
MSSPSLHTSKTYESELRLLQEKLLLMASLVEEMMRKGEIALTTRDSHLAEVARLIDRRINHLECEVDELCMRILATRQPVASDLRFVTAALKIVTDLERIGDLCVNVCERVVELNEEPRVAAIDEVALLAAETRGLLCDALDAFVTRNVDRAMELLSRDDGIDEHYASIFSGILEMMAREPSAIYRATRVQSVAKYLERIADHAENIAEAVVFIVKGKDIRHAGRRSAT